ASAPAKPLSPEELLAQQWSKVGRKFIDHQIDQRLDAQIAKLSATLLEKVRAPWKTGAAEKTTWVDYQKLADDVAKMPEFKGYKPEYKKTTLLDISQLGDLEGIGKSFAKAGNQYVPFSTLATSVKELVTVDKDNPAARFALQVGLDGPILRDDTDGQGN